MKLKVLVPGMQDSVVSRVKVVGLDSEETGGKRRCRYKALAGIRFAKEMQAALGLGEETRSATRSAADRPLGGINILATEIIVNVSPCGTAEQQGYSDKGRQQAN
jgi:hypothetical protein